MLLPAVDAAHHQMQNQHLQLDQFYLGIPLQLLQVQSRNQNTSSPALSRGRHSLFPRSCPEHGFHQPHYGSSW